MSTTIPWWDLKRAFVVVDLSTNIFGLFVDKIWVGKNDKIDDFEQQFNL